MKNENESGAITSYLNGFLNPPTFILPETIRRCIRELIEYQDVDWLRRHTECPRKEWDLPDNENKWGPHCSGCFTSLPAQETIGRIEIAIAINHILSAKEKEFQTPEILLKNVLSSLTLLQETLDRLVSVGWTQLFLLREEFQKFWQVLSDFRNLMQSLDKSPATHPPDLKGPDIEAFDISFIRLLAEILAKGGLGCFVVHAEGKAIYSPGMEILILCLGECGRSPEVAIVEAILAQKVDSNGDTA